MLWAWDSLFSWENDGETKKAERRSFNLVAASLADIVAAHTLALVLHLDSFWHFIKHKHAISKPTTGSFTVSTRRMILVPPRKFSRILISRLIFFFLTG